MLRAVVGNGALTSAAVPLRPAARSAWPLLAGLAHLPQLAGHLLYTKERSCHQKEEARDKRMLKWRHSQAPSTGWDLHEPTFCASCALLHLGGWLWLRLQPCKLHCYGHVLGRYLLHAELVLPPAQ